MIFIENDQPELLDCNLFLIMLNADINIMSVVVFSS